MELLIYLGTTINDSALPKQLRFTFHENVLIGKIHRTSSDFYFHRRVISCMVFFFQLLSSSSKTLKNILFYLRPPHSPPQRLSAVRSPPSMLLRSASGAEPLAFNPFVLLLLH